MIKSAISVLALAFLFVVLAIAPSHTFANISLPAMPQLQLAHCSTSDSTDYKFIDIYGTFDDSGTNISNVATVTSLNSDVGQLNMLVPGGAGMILGKTVITFSDIIEAGNTFTVTGKTALLKLKNGTNVNFTDCK